MKSLVVPVLVLVLFFAVMFYVVFPAKGPEEWVLTAKHENNTLIVEGFKDKESCEYYFDSNFPETVKHTCRPR